MPLRPIAFIVTAILLLSPTMAKRGVGVSGPDQVFSLTPGSNLSSYLRVYNTGDEVTTYSVKVEGNVSRFLSPESDSIVIDPGENQKLELTYRTKHDDLPGEYTGSFLVSIGGQQVSPGVSKRVRIIIAGTAPNRPPKIAFLSPTQGKVSGEVDIRVNASDPDGDRLTIHIFVDGDMVSESEIFVWDTTQVEEGTHNLTATASDGEDLERAELSVVVDNVEQNRDWLWIVTSLGLFVIFLILAAARGASHQNDARRENTD